MTSLTIVKPLGDVTLKDEAARLAFVRILSAGGKVFANGKELDSFIIGAEMISEGITTEIGSQRQS